MAAYTVQVPLDEAKVLLRNQMYFSTGYMVCWSLFAFMLFLGGVGGAGIWVVAIAGRFYIKTIREHFKYTKIGNTYGTVPFNSNYLKTSAMWPMFAMAGIIMGSQSSHHHKQP